GPYVKQRAVVSERYNTVSMLRTIEEILGIRQLGLFDSLQLPMTEVFSTKQTQWTYSARVPGVLRTTQLPLPAPTAQEHPAAPPRRPDHGAATSVGLDFSFEDRLDAARFNLVLWNGLKGEDVPYPEDRDGRHLSRNRKSLLREQGCRLTPARACD